MPINYATPENWQPVKLILESAHLSDIFLIFATHSCKNVPEPAKIQGGIIIAEGHNYKIV